MNGLTTLSPHISGSTVSQPKLGSSLTIKTSSQSIPVNTSGHLETIVPEIVVRTDDMDMTEDVTPPPSSLKQVQPTYVHLLSLAFTNIRLRRGFILPTERSSSWTKYDSGYRV
jgi:hypothetical protein